LLALNATRHLTVSATTTLNAGSALSVADAAFQTGVLKLNGGSYTAANLTGVSALEYVAGSLTLTGSGGLTIGAGGPVSTVTLATGDALHVPGTTQVTGGGALTVAGGAFTTDVLAINAGSYAAADLSGPTAIQFNVGTLGFTGDYTIAASSPLQQVLGGQLVVGLGRRVTVAGAATLLAPFRLGGGRLTVGQLVNPQLLDRDAGTLDITGADLAVDHGGIWGSAITVRDGTTLNIGQTTTVAAIGLIDVQNNARFGSTTLVNNGEIRLDGWTATVEAGSLQNNGMLRGYGRVDGPVANNATGNVAVGAGERLRFLGATVANAGHLSALGSSAAMAELEFAGVTTNAAGTGLITGARAQMRFEGGLVNQGSVAISGGVNHIYGAIENTGDIVVTAGAKATFYGDIEQNGSLQVSKVGETTSRAVFLGAVTGAGGVTGGGEIFFEGDLRPGNSPAQVNYAADIFFGGGTTLTMELGGVTPGLQHDQIVVAGSLTLGGSLELSLIDAFTPFAGEQFTLATATAGISGAFSDIMFPSLTGLAWAVEQTATSLSVRLVPSNADFNADGHIDGADFLAWQRGVGRIAAAPGDGDANSDGNVDGADLDIWRTSAISGGATAPAAAPATVHALSAVPEPTSALLVSVAISAGIALSRRRKS
jgi:hypothetical protein